ncbi:MAG: NfeD family protein [Candidatus Dormibacteraeota bacterium]|nr:NfeD family protein [Candidatus Dormibacteraeota bacterium]
MTLVWLGIALMFAIVEVSSVALYAGFVAIGAVGAALAAFVGVPVPFQAVVFAAVSFLGLAGVRTPLMRYLKVRSHPDNRPGAWAMIGQTATVVDPIQGSERRGHVRIAGEDWPAVTADGSPATQGSTVRIVDIHRTTLVVDRDQ